MENSMNVLQVPALRFKLHDVPTYYYMCRLFQYLGEWYEVERYFAWFEFGGKCVTANYSLNEDSSMKIINKQISSL